MKGLLSFLLLVTCVGGAAVQSARAACGDGVLQAGEACDESAPNGDATCPGRCIDPPSLEACQCATLSSDYRDFAIIADLQARIGANANVTGGGVAVTTPGGFLYVGASATLPGGSQAIADRCRLLPGSNVGRLFCNEALILPGAFANGGGPFPFTPPVPFPTLPAFPTGSGGGANVDVTFGDTQYLAPGAYGTIIVEPKGTLVLHGLNFASGVGRYDVTALKVTGGGRLYADNPVVINVDEAFRLTGESILGPTPLSPVQPGDIRISVAGRAAKLGKGAFVQAHVRSAKGKIVVGKGTIAVGQLIGPKVTLQKGSLVQLAGGCGDGVKQNTEVCDTTAPGGDSACPGECIPLGQAGQCTCSCSTNADCNDGNACNGVETCDSGHCVLGTPPSCSDNNPCTIDCNPATGCVHVAVTDGATCDDGDECTRADTCVGGTCQPGELRTCNDGNDCTADSCDPATGCIHTDLTTGTGCSDNNLCTEGDVCIRGRCIGGAPAGCDDLNPCTVDSCDPLIGCQHLPVTNGISCAGTSPCTALDLCSNGVCVPRGAQLCNDSNPCTTDTCTPMGPLGSQTADCTHTQVPNLTPCSPPTPVQLVCFNGVCQ